MDKELYRAVSSRNTDAAIDFIMALYAYGRADSKETKARTEENLIDRLAKLELAVVELKDRLSCTDAVSQRKADILMVEARERRERRDGT